MTANDLPGSERHAGGDLPAISLPFRLAMVLTFANAIWFVWSNRFLLLGDYPDSVYQGWLFARLLTGQSPAGYTVARYPVPNSTVTVAIGILDLIFQPEISGKLVVTLGIALFILGSLYLLKSLNGSERNPILFATALFVFNGFLLCGELAYFIGLGVFFLYAGYLIRRLRWLGNINPAIVLVASCALFFTHIADYAAAILVSAAIVLTRPGKETLTRLVLPFFPSGAMLIWSFVGQRSSGGPAAGAVWHFWSMHQFAGAIVGAFSLFPGFPPWIEFGAPATRVAAMLNFLSCSAMVLACIATCLDFAGSRDAKAAIPMATLLCSVAVIATGYAYGIFVSPGERFLFPAAWLALCWIGSWLSDSRYDRARRLAAIALFALAVVQGVYLDAAAARVSVHLSDTYAKLRRTRNRGEFCDAYQKLFTRSWPQPHRSMLESFFPTYATMIRVPYYIYVEDATNAPINPVGLIVKQPNGDYTNACGPGAVARGSE